MMHGIPLFKPERAPSISLLGGPNRSITRPADNEQAIMALNSSSTNSAIELKSDPLNLFGKFGQSVKALERLSNDITTLTDLTQGLINPSQRAAIEKELEAQKAEVVRVTSTDDFQKAKAILQDIWRKLERGESRESISALWFIGGIHPSSRLSYQQ